MRVLIAWGSKNGGTEGIARMLGEVLAARGFEVSLASADEVKGLERYDAVIVGGAIYMNRWYAVARRFVRRHVDALRRVPVWFFSSGPIDDSADRKDLPAPSQVAALAEWVGARGHITFGGRLDPNAKGFAARTMARTQSGDFRNPARIRAWGAQVAAQLPTATPGMAIDLPGPSASRWVAHGVVGWAACSLILMTLLRVASRGGAIGVHLVATPLIFAVVARNYFQARGAREPMPTALLWTALSLALDLVVVGALAQRDLWMFKNGWATWLPYWLTFFTTWLVGAIVSTLPWPQTERQARA